MTRRTDIMEFVARKLAPYMLLFGLYLVTYGASSPGGGFQGGVVIASGIILISMARSTGEAEQLVPRARLKALEAVTFSALLLVGAVGAVAGLGFLGDVVGRGPQDGLLPAARFVWLLNVLIGFKVAAGTSLICLYLFGEAES